MAHMTSSREEIFLSYVLVESGRAVRHFDRVFELATEVDITDVGESRPLLSLLDALHAALHFYANVSRVFWPPRNSRKQSGAKLRALCELDQNHMMSDRRLRDHVEHMDERIEDWTSGGRIPYLNYEMVDYYPDADRPTPIRDVTLLVYDAASRTVHIRDQSYGLEALRNAVLDVQSRASQAFEILMRA